MYKNMTYVAQTGKKNRDEKYSCLRDYMASHDVIGAN